MQLQSVGPESRKHVAAIKRGNETISAAPRCTRIDEDAANQ